jgi:predicted flap endonuclease-1-like 5' DNA nuclease
MFLVGQIFLFLALALIIGGAIGYAVRSCLADTACDDIREDLELERSRNAALLESQIANETRHVEAKAIAVLETSGSNLAALSTPELEAVLLDSAPGTPLKRRFGGDDLTVIRGITPKIDVWLGLQGITRFSHLANLTPSELYWLVENLPERGASVYRDHWIAQAMRLAKETSGS